MVKGASGALLETAIEHPFLLFVALVFLLASCIHSLTLSVELLTVMSRHLRRQVHHLVEACRYLWSEVKEWRLTARRL